MMATRAAATRGNADWRAAWHRSMRRAGQIGGAAAALALLVFLTLALASYAQTDPSGSTAASSQDIANWMGAPGAWVAERGLMVFGVSGLSGREGVVGGKSGGGSVELWGPR